jgi:phenylacetate-CoA ligase
LESLKESEQWSTNEQIAYVAFHLRKILLHAVQNVPRYHCMKYLEQELLCLDTDVFALLTEFPVIDRSQIIDDPDTFLSTAFSRQTLKPIITSGTTGTPMKTWVEPHLEHINDALVLRRNVWAGYHKGDWIARLVGDSIVPLNAPDSNNHYRISKSDHRIYLSTFHMNPDVAREFASLLESRKPHFIMGYPSALESLAHLAGKGSGNWRPKAVLYSSEPLYEHQRTEIEDYFSAPIRGFYGCAERVVSAAQCKNGKYHLSLVDGYFEGQFGRDSQSILDSNCPALVTTLLNRAMPLIRYELGDTLSVNTGQSCECGCTLPILSPVLTKLEDSVVTPSGRVVSPSILTWAFKDLPGLMRSQIVQTSPSTIEVLIVVDDKLVLNVANKLTERLEKFTFGEMSISVKIVPDLKLTKAGKTRFVVNEYRRRSDENNSSSFRNSIPIN